ncbi:TIGR02757 family protein [Treponema bryantii]|uniref:TIGR02757 family protein n=1 Tax=Treponema bryantii TaxID=163 RepID=A0A1I3HUP4_9SPIR|nr:DUF2400 domain-containing protein [Treponema bryantii]SFI39382.1 TIGR02757 family protein [Treponema bryantii]
MTGELKKKLVALADKYEVPSFTEADPSQFLRWYKPEEGCGTVADVEVASFIAAMLAFGNRKQFIPKIRCVLETADRSLGSVTEWLKAGAYAGDFPKGVAKFYRFYSYDDMQVFFGELADVLKQYGTLGEYFKNRELATIFPKSSIVPKGRSSANKRIHMFLRWMVRRGSLVDLGLWEWADPASLIIPLDVHVMQEAAKLGLIPETAGATRKTAELLTTALSEAFPGDPCRGDFALFGLGVDVL